MTDTTNVIVRFWECECCGSLLVTTPDDATDYQCPQCHKMNCSEGRYCEISRDQFMTEIEGHFEVSYRP